MVPVAHFASGPVGFGLNVLLAVGIAVAAWAYFTRVQTLAAGDHHHAPVPGWRQVCFVGGLALVAAALSPPIDDLSDQLLAVHMIQHLMLGDVASLLLVLGLTGPLLVPLLRHRWIDRLRVLVHPLVALPLWAINFYGWHTSFMYQLALHHEGIHGVQHLTFIVFGALLWMALLGPLPKPEWFGNLARLGYIVVVRLTGTVLANVFLFAGTVFYAYYIPEDAKWHISPLTDQIIAGSVMMVEESLLTIGLFCWLFLKAARESDQRQELLDLAAERDVELDPRRAARAVAAGRGDALRERVLAAATPPPPAAPPSGAGLPPPDGAPAPLRGGS